MKNKRSVYEFLIGPTEKVCVEFYDQQEGGTVSIETRFPLDKYVEYWEPTLNRLTIEAKFIPELIKALDKAYGIFLANMLAQSKIERIAE